MAPAPTMDLEDGFAQDWQELLNTHPVMHMTREGIGELLLHTLSNCKPDGFFVYGEVEQLPAVNCVRPTVLR